MDYKEVMAELVKVQREKAVLKAAKISDTLKNRMMNELEARERALEGPKETPEGVAAPAGTLSRK